MSGQTEIDRSMEALGSEEEGFMLGLDLGFWSLGLFLFLFLKTLVKPLRFGFESEERERERRGRDGAVQWNCSEKIKCFIEENDYFVLIIIVLN